VGVPAKQRPTDVEYDRFVFLVDLFRRLDYDEAAIYSASPFVVQDPLVNTILSKANEDLLSIAEVLGEDTGKIREWHEQTNRALREKMGHTDHAAYDVFDLVANERIGTITASGFMPLLCGAPSPKPTLCIAASSRQPFVRCTTAAASRSRTTT